MTAQGSEEPFKRAGAARSGGRRGLARALFLLPLAAAFLAHVWANFHYAVNMPFWDDYDAVLDFLNRLSVTHGFADRLKLFFSLHNEHRLVFGRLVETAYLHLSGKVDFFSLIGTGELGLYLIVALFVVQARRRLGADFYLAAPAAIVLLAFSQHALMAKFAMASLQQYYQLFFALVALYLATLPQRARWLPLVLFFATLSSFTGGGGLVTFAVLLLFFLAVREWKLALIEGLYAVLVLATYFYLLPFGVTEIGRASHALALSHPARLVRFVLAFLGSVGGDHYLIAGAALAVLGALVFALSTRRSGGRPDFPALAGLLVVGTAVGAGWSRVSMGVYEAASSRYAIYSLVFLAALILALLASWRGGGGRRALALAALLLSVLVVGAWFAPANRILARRQRILKDSLVYPDQARAMEILAASMKLGIFQPIPPVYQRLPPALPLTRSDLYGPGYLGRISRVALRGDQLVVEGWAAVPPGRKPAEAVILEVNGRFYPAVYGYRRLYGQRRPLRYNARLRLIPLPQVLTVSVIVVGPERDRFYRSPEKIVYANGSGNRRKQGSERGETPPRPDA